MAERPLILFADPMPVDKARRYGGSSEFQRPTHQRQVERLSPKFSVLQQALERDRVRIEHDPDGTVPEYTLVLEVAGDPNDFETAVKNLNDDTKHLEWLFEVVDDSVPNSESFYRTKNNERDDSKTMTFKYFCILTNRRALEEILSLWQSFQGDENYTFPYGQTGLHNVFKTLSDIHLWGVKERLEETDVLQVWKEELCDPDVAYVKCEIELFFRQSQEKRAKSQVEISEYIRDIGGTVITASLIEAIGYQAILASIPRQYAERIIKRENVELVLLDQIMFFKPTGQSIVLGSEDGLPFEKEFREPDNIIDEPIIALFDGLPQERHPLLSGVLSIDDPDDFTASYQIADRQHGTSMASLIARGDLSNSSESLSSHRIYVRPIMKPYPASEGTREYIPDNMLIVDKIHEAVRRLYEPNAGKVASSIRVINLSIGIGARMYYNMISPLAKLLDWLSFKYRVLFIVSAGNHSEDIDLGITFDNYKGLTSEQRDVQMIRILNQNSRNHRLLSPAESINALTVGALFCDGSEWVENPRQLLPCSGIMPSPISSMGRGVNNSIKPDILYPGGRSVLFENFGATSIGRWRKGTSISPPGILSARPRTLAGTTNVVGYSFGTSDSAALVSHEAAKCYDVLSEVFRDELDVDVPHEYASLLLKAMLVHGAKWNPSSQLICRETNLPGRGADQIHRWMGYGVPDVSRVIECAKNRITLIGYGELIQDAACLYTLPLPFNFSTKRIYRSLTITLASFTPIRPSSQKYRCSQLWFTLESAGKSIGITRLDADDKAVARGTIQHERFAGESAVIWGEDDTLGIKVNCRVCAHGFTEAVPYALMATFEIAPNYDIDVYQKVADKIKLRAGIAPT